MKKLTLAIFTVLLLTNLSFAQEPKADGQKAGLEECTDSAADLGRFVNNKDEDKSKAKKKKKNTIQGK